MYATSCSGRRITVHSVVRLPCVFSREESRAYFGGGRGDIGDRRRPLRCYACGHRSPCGEFVQYELWGDIWAGVSTSRGDVHARTADGVDRLHVVFVPAERDQEYNVIMRLRDVGMRAAVATIVRELVRAIMKALSGR